MKHISKRLKNIWKDESAQGATEYILLLVVIIALLVAFKEPLISAVTNKINQLQSQISSFSGN